MSSTDGVFRKECTSAAGQNSFEAPHLDVLPHGVDDGGSCGRVNSEQPRQPVDQLVLGGFVVEGEDDGGPRRNIARTTHLQGGVEGERRRVKVFNLRSCEVITGHGGTTLSAKSVPRIHHSLPPASVSATV